MFGIFKKFKGTNHEQAKITSMQYHDPIDKMVEKEMAQLKAIKDEKEQEEMITEHRGESKDVVEVLSKFSARELIEALKQKEDVQISTTHEDTYRVEMDLTKVKKYVVVINNCNPHLVERHRMLLEADRYLGGKKERMIMCDY